MRKYITCFLFSIVGMALNLSVHAKEPENLIHPSVKRAFNLAPNVVLHYSIKAKQRGIPLGGESTWQWQAQQQQYRINNEVRANLFGKIQESKSEGQIDDYGLAPLQFTEKRFRKEPSTTQFNAQSKQISFSEASLTYPILGGEQDRSSVIWQLIATIRASPKQMIPGGQWVFFVAGRRDAETWVFKVVQQENILTPMGKLNSWHLIKLPPVDSKDQQLDIWLSPNLDWYPIRLRFSDADGDFVDQTLEKIEKQ